MIDAEKISEILLVRNFFLDGNCFSLFERVEDVGEGCLLKIIEKISET